ncbi:hypothetical protein FNAPI_13036 [Fusarium napiforme]|uniref:Uncharacterized protein n=1 Tax=Fusarium napiforme TaxID=42672 RepID=A0A8H5MJ62_9HYPO|nr:hypothetical protein FNAPI_13036 [Fusarium napiforme]
MAPPRRRFAKPITSRRYLALRHQRRKIQQLDDSDKALKPGYKEIISFDRPGLLGGTYTINVAQSISEDPRDPPNPKEKPPQIRRTLSQKFEVLAPRFELPADVIYSFYPEQGHEVTHDVLPHIVFNDCMLPWERIGSADAEEHQPDDYDKNRVPWVALLVFSPDELLLSDNEIAAIFGNTSIKKPVKQSETMAVRVTMTDLLGLKSERVRLPFADIKQATKPDTALIFPTAALFNGLFAAYNEKNEPVGSPTGAPDLSRHRFLAHMMRMNTEGMANADEDEHETIREFSTVLANRVGPQISDKASPMIAHLVSLENVESLKPFPLSPTKVGDDPVRVALISLYSWSYTCLPPNSLDVRTAFEKLAAGADMLKPIVPLQENPDAVVKRMINRLEDGFTVIRSRMATGEETAALFRGALTPNLVPAMKWDLLSNTGSNLNIFDQELGMMDMTYSSAWSLGRTLALADRAFTISLTRVRHEIIVPATDKARSQMLKATSRRHYSRLDLLSSLDGLVDDLVDISRTADEARWIRQASNEAPNLSYTSIGPFLESAIEDSASKIAASINKGSGGDLRATANPPYDEFNEPVSPDWMVVLRFVLDLYNLVNVPSHYLLTDQSLLPLESLRFFFVDHNWIDAMIDGALSLGFQGASADHPKKQSGDMDDPVRRAIKKLINRLFEDPQATKPAIPRFGFYLRSAVVAQFPDLKVSVEVTGAPSGDAYLLRHDVIDKDTMLGFFSDAPLKDGLHGLRFELPAHQQYFSVGSINNTDLVISYKRQYTKFDHKDPQRQVAVTTIRWYGGGKGRSDNEVDTRERDQVIIWGTTPGNNDLRLLLVERLAADVHQTLFTEMAKLDGTWYTEKKPTSAMAAYQLTSPSWQLQVGPMNSSLDSVDVLETVAQISGCLSYKEAVTSSLASTLDVDSILPPKVQHNIPDLQQRFTQPGLVYHAVPPRVVWRMHQPIQSPIIQPSSWELVASAGSDPDLDSDSEEISVLPPPRINMPLRTNAGLPKFSYHVATTDTPSTFEIPMIDRKQDLIFSIVYEGFGKDFRLQFLTITIPAVSSPGVPPNTLLQTPISPDANLRMVSNLRFNGRMSYSNQKKALEIRLVPRSQEGRLKGVKMDDWKGEWKDDNDSIGRPIPVYERTEMSVVLHQVKVMCYDDVEKGKTRGCPLKVHVEYWGDNSSDEELWAVLKNTEAA